MPKLSAAAVRASLAYLMLGFTFGALMLANKGVPFWPGIWSLLPAHIETMLLGWLGNLVLGVAFWILPRYPGGSRGDERLAWLAAGLLNGGIWLAIGGGLTAMSGLTLLGKLLEACAAAAFALHAWGRVRALVPAKKPR